MTVADLIERLKGMPPEAKVYYASFLGFGSDGEEEALVYDLDFEHRTVQCISEPLGVRVPYTGVIFEID